MINKESDDHSEYTSKANTYPVVQDAKNSEAAEGSGGSEESVEESPAEDSNPLLEGPDPEPVESPDVPECPECGGTEWFDPREVSNGQVDFDYGCPSCSTEAEWVVWNE